MTPKQNPNKFPLWQFLNQPLFSSTTKAVLNPRRFWYVYKIELLERCWDREYDSKGHYHN